MVDQKQSTAELNLVAIDIAKEWNVVFVQEATGARRSFKVANRRADHDRLISYLKSLRGSVQVAFEPTGDYHRPLAYRLLTEGFAVRSVSSVAVARMREARYGTWDKNDPKDAQVILYMMAQGMVQTYYDPLFSGTHDIQELANTYCQIQELLPPFPRTINKMQAADVKLRLFSEVFCDCNEDIPTDRP